MMKSKEDNERRSDCPLSCSLDLVGDKWSLLIIRDMMLFGKTTYNEFLASKENISTNILNDRLVMLTSAGVITFSGSAKRKKYSLTKLGHDLKPVIEAFAHFGMKNFKGSKKYMEGQMKDYKKRGA